MKTVLITIPVYNEEIDIPKNIPILYDFCEKNLQNYDWKIVIVDNMSKDTTWLKIQELSKKYPEKINGLKLDKKGEVGHYATHGKPAKLNMFLTWMLICLQI